MTIPKDIVGRWQDIFKAIANRHTDPNRFSRVFIGGIHQDVETSWIAKKKKKNADGKITKKNPPTHYYVGSNFQNIYLTVREADCMALLLRYYTNSQVAQQLNLSARTVEFYIKNMRQKLNCHSKAHLIETLRQTDFVQHVEEILLRLNND